nr:helix-turn-helix domain-containing protein [Maliibacterium massiliense]
MRSYRLPASRVCAVDSARIYIAPPSALREAVAHYTLTMPPDALAQLLPCAALPAQCAMQDASPTLTLVPDASGCLVYTMRTQMITGMLWGATTCAVQVRNDADTVPMRFFIEFLPGGLSRFLGEDVATLTDTRLDTRLVHAALDADIRTAILRAQEDLSQLLPGVDAALLRHDRQTQLHPAAQCAKAHLFASHGALPMRTLAATVGYSARHMMRLFHASLGLTPKAFARLVRVNYAVQQLQRDPNASLTALAQQAGYFDQAHFVHDFAQVLGVPPSRYRADLSQFYNEPLKF